MKQPGNPGTGGGVPGYATVVDMPYRAGTDGADDMGTHCRLDLYYPTHTPGFATVVWVHGGGLKEQGRFIPDALREQGLAVVAVDYRLNPLVKAPAYIEDVAAAVAWVLDHIEVYGGSRGLVFVSGHSAGCYLGDLVVLDRHYLAAHGHDANELAGNISLSAHKVTHFTVREEQGLGAFQTAADVFAPLFHVRADAPPMLLVTGDRDLELLGRYEENAYFWRMMRVAGHADITLSELKGLDHGGMLEPSLQLLLAFVRRIVAARPARSPHRNAD